MTSHHLAAAPAKPQSPAAARQAKASTFRRVSRSVLVAGTVLALAAAFGPTWLVRVGVVVAVIAAVVACAFAWRELFATDRRHARQMLAATQEHGVALTEERTRNASVVDTLTKRITAATVTIEGQQVTIATLRSEVSSLKGDNAYLKGEVAHRETVIASLRDTVRSREAELITLRNEGDSAELHHMPRRVLAEHESSWSDVPDADELWSDGSHPTVVDLKMLETALPNDGRERQVG